MNKLVKDKEKPLHLETGVNSSS